MSLAITLATTRRIALQLRRDHRTVGLLIFVKPSVLMILLRYVLDAPGGAFDRYGPDPHGRVPVRRHVHRQNERRHAARTHERHARTPDDHAARAGSTCCWATP